MSFKPPRTLVEDMRINDLNSALQKKAQEVFGEKYGKYAAFWVGMVPALEDAANQAGLTIDQRLDVLAIMNALDHV